MRPGIKADSRAGIPLGFQKWGKSDSDKQILFIHGWGMNSSIWCHIAAAIEQTYAEYSIIAVDLPGYGKSTAYPIALSGKNYNAHSLAQSLQPLLTDKQTILIAWSMGGLPAIELAGKQSTEIQQLILVSSTPCFVQAEHWPHAVEVAILEKFYQQLLSDHQNTLKRFLAIQAMGSKTARQDTKFLYKQLFNRGQPDNQALDAGLEILLKEDQRQQLQEILNIPIHLISGKRDTLVNYAGQIQLAEQDNISLHGISDASHAPFISHPEAFMAILKQCIAAN